MPSEHNRLDSLGSTIASFVIWCLSIPLNAIPIYLKYLTDKSTTLSPCHYILADKECTFIFVAVGFKSLQPLSLKDLKETSAPNFFYA